MRRLFGWFWTPDRHYSKTARIAFPFLFCWAAVTGLSESQALAGSQYDAAIERLMASTFSDPQLKGALLARLRANCSKPHCKDEDRRLGFELTKNGVPRLDGPTLVARARLLSVILQNVDDKSCAALSRGASDTTQLEAAVEKLGPAFIDAWMAVASKALIAELKQVPPRKVTDRELRQAEAEFRSRLTGQERRRFAALPDEESSLSDTDVCWVTRLTYDKLPTLSEPHRSVMAVHLVNPN